MKTEGDMRVLAAKMLEQSEAALEERKDLRDIERQFLERMVLINRLFLKESMKAEGE